MRHRNGQLRGPLRRFVVQDRSMQPSLHPGQGLLATPYGAAKPGQIRCFEHRPGFWLVKRVGEVHADATMTVYSDNTDVATIDSREFGPVPIAGSYRVLIAIPLRWM